MSGIVYVGLGSNIRPVHHARAALRLLRASYPGIRASSLYRTAPAHGRGPPFVNAAVAVPADGPVETLETRLAAIERALGRIRSADRNAPRTIDLDVLVARRDGRLLLHADVRRAHALVPLLEIAPELADDEGRPLRDLLPTLPAQGVRRLPRAGIPRVTP